MLTNKASALTEKNSQLIFNFYFCKNKKDMDSSEPIKTAADNDPVQKIIHSDGALGILALGAVGIKAWRKVRLEEKEKSNKKT